MWLREAFPSVLPSLIINGALTVNGLTKINGNLEIDQNDRPGIYYGVPVGSTRTTFGLQCQPRFGNSWFTPGTGVERLTVAQYPGGFVHLTGLVSNTTPAFRNDGVYAFDFTNTVFAQSFIPACEIHMLADGRDRANNNQPVFVIGTDGTVRCYNLDNTTAAQVDYRISHTYNIFTTPGKYEGSGGF